MPVWSVEPIEYRPEVTLSGWRVCEVSLEGDQPLTRHFIGYSEEDRQGQVSSPVQWFDPRTASGITRSGPVYRLDGRPGMGQDASYVWAQWKRIWQITQERDVTNKVPADLKANRCEQST